MNSRWYLAAFPVAFIACSGEGTPVPVYGVPYSSGGASNAQNTGGRLAVGGNATGGINNGFPTGGTTNSNSMAVRYGPISTLGTGGTQ